MFEAEIHTHTLRPLMPCMQCSRLFKSALCWRLKSNRLWWKIFLATFFLQMAHCHGPPRGRSGSSPTLLANTKGKSSPALQPDGLCITVLVFDCQLRPGVKICREDEKTDEIRDSPGDVDGTLDQKWDKSISRRTSYGIWRICSKYIASG